MRKTALAAFLTAHTCLAATAWAQAAVPPLNVTVNGIENGKLIPESFAYCVPDGKGQSKNGDNVSPGLTWTNAPAATKSFAVIVVDKDVPSSFELANKTDKTIPDTFPRRDFYHWVLVDIPANATGLPKGAYSQSPATPNDLPPIGVSGQNSYAEMGKDSGIGYDGPCPPWNDERLHHYHFVVYALDVPTLGLTGTFTGKQAEDAMVGHILAKGEVTGIYTQNAKLMAH